MGSALIPLINLIVNAFTLLIVVNVILSYFLSPYHPAREFLERLVEPFLNPLRRIIPPAGGLDFSPMVLLIVVQLIGQILIGLLRAL
jgi:YggT family protein